MTDDERAILRFEETHPRDDRTKEAAVRETFGYSWVRHRQKLMQVVERADVVEEFAIVAHRVQRRAIAGRRARAARSFSTAES